MASHYFVCILWTSDIDFLPGVFTVHLHILYYILGFFFLSFFIWNEKISIFFTLWYLVLYKSTLFYKVLCKVVLSGLLKWLGIMNSVELGDLLRFYAWDTKMWKAFNSLKEMKSFEVNENAWGEKSPQNSLLAWMPMV